MYSEYEKPIIKCTIFYYDTDYKKSTAEQIFEILEKYNMFPPEKFYAGKLTRNRFIYANEQTKDVMVQAYAEKNVLGIAMASGNSRKVEEYWSVDWSLTFYKNSKLAVEPTFMPWNVLSIESTHGRLQDPAVYRDFFLCMKDLIKLIHPFYARVDDVDNAVTLMDRTKERRFVPDYIQQIYWGNYFGSMHCNHYGMDKIEKIPASNVEKIGDGVFFSLTDHVLEYNTRECKQARRRVEKYLKK